jgi:hypothetical protein
MPLKPFTVEITNGWKANENNRVGPVVVMNWEQKINSFAPTLDDLNRMALAIELVRKVDRINKELINCYKDVETINKLKGQVQCL